MRILVVEDEVDLAEPLAKGLRRQGYAVDMAPDGQAAFDLIEVEQYDLAIVDIGLPGMDGFELTRRVREVDGSSFPILLLTAREAPMDRVRGLDGGADDYLVKPFYMEELSARIRALLRRRSADREPLLRCRDLTLDRSERIVTLQNKPLTLSRKELAILEFLMHHPGKVISHEELLEHVWDAQVNPFTNVIPVHIASLRRALGESARLPRYIETVPGQGYRLIASEKSLS